MCGAQTITAQTITHVSFPKPQLTTVEGGLLAGLEPWEPGVLAKAKGSGEGACRKSSMEVELPGCDSWTMGCGCWKVMGWDCVCTSCSWTAWWGGGWMGTWSSGWMGAWGGGWMGAWGGCWMGTWGGGWMGAWGGCWMERWAGRGGMECCCVEVEVVGAAGPTVASPTFAGRKFQMAWNVFSWKSRKDARGTAWAVLANHLPHSVRSPGGYCGCCGSRVPMAACSWKNSRSWDFCYSK